MLIYRMAMEQLQKWKTKKRRKPLIIRGARQVGKVEFLDLYPLSFFEFMMAMDKERYVELLRKGDFVIDNGSDVIPVEVKAEVNLQAKSLKVYQDKFQPKLSIRTSMADYQEEEWLLNLPLWVIEIIEK